MDMVLVGRKGLDQVKIEDPGLDAVEIYTHSERCSGVL